LIQISLKVKKYQAKAEEFVSYKNKTKQKCKIKCLLQTQIFDVIVLSIYKINFNEKLG